MKLLLMGPAGVGKTSLLKTTMEKSTFMQVENLAPTRGISRETYRFRGLLEITAWDAGGQSIYVDRYYGSQEENVFGETDLAVYMVEATISEDDSLKSEFDRFANKVVEKNPDIKKIYVLINKVDLEGSKEDEILDLLSKDLPGDLARRIDFTKVSVKAGSAQKRLIEICDEVIEARVERMAKMTKLRGIMEDFKKATNGSDIILFHKQDGLVMTSTFGKFDTANLKFVSFQLSALESNLHAVYSNVLEMRNEKISPLAINIVMFESASNYVFCKEVEDKASLMVVTKEKSPEVLQKVTQVINDRHQIYEQLINVLEFD